MNKDQIQGTVENVTGKIQEKAGHAIGNPTQEAKGVQKQVSGKAQQLVGDLKEIVKDATKK